MEVRIPIFLEGVMKNAKQLGESISKNIKAVSSVAGSGAGGAMAVGMLAGAGFAIANKVLGDIFNAVKDTPMVVAMAKLFKLLLTLLLLPLIPILKPALEAMLLLYDTLKPFVDSMTAFFNELASSSGGVIQGIFIAIILPFVGAITLLLLIFAGLVVVVKLVVLAFKWAFDALKNVGKWIWNQIIKPAFMFLIDAGEALWNQIIKPAWEFMSDVVSWLWTDVIEPAWGVMRSITGWLWNQVIKPAWNVMKDVGAWIWKILKSPFEWLAKKIRWIADKLNIGGGGSDLDDGVITPSGQIIRTNPADYLIATKNPASLGGGSVVVNVNYPSVRSDSDIKTLVRQIEDNIYKNMRRYNSYV